MAVPSLFSIHTTITWVTGAGMDVAVGAALGVGVGVGVGVVTGWLQAANNKVRRSTFLGITLAARYRSLRLTRQLLGLAGVP